MCIGGGIAIGGKTGLGTILQQTFYYIARRRFLQTIRPLSPSSQSRRLAARSPPGHGPTLPTLPAP
jgi:hypothetical protein